MTTLLAIDAETKQLPKTLSVFNELRIDERKCDKHPSFVFFSVSHSVSLSLIDEVCDDISMLL